MKNSHSLIRFAVAASLVATSTGAFGADANPEAWKTTAGINLAVAKGNSDTLLAGANILSLKKWDKNEVSVGADAAYGDSKIDGKRSTTAQNYGAFLQYNRLINDRWFGYLNGSARQDRIALVDYRVTLSPGIGYYFIKTERTQLSGEVGPGIVFEKLDGDSKTYFTIRFAEHFKHKINDRAHIFQNLEFLPQVDKFDNYVINADLGIEAKVTEKAALRVTFADTYRSDPAPGRKANDLKLLAGLNYTF